MNSWSSVDCFSRTLSGPAWLEGMISVNTIRDWALSEDHWWRRAALVSTVALNVRTHGGTGDVTQTLAICEMLIEDRDEVYKEIFEQAENFKKYQRQSNG